MDSRNIFIILFPLVIGFLIEIVCNLLPMRILRLLDISLGVHYIIFLVMIGTYILFIRDKLKENKGKDKEISDRDTLWIVLNFIGYIILSLWLETVGVSRIEKIDVRWGRWRKWGLIRASIFSLEFWRHFEGLNLGIIVIFYIGFISLYISSLLVYFWAKDKKIYYLNNIGLWNSCIAVILSQC